MIKTLTKHGNSWALIVDRPILDLLKIGADTPLEGSTDGTQLIISPQVATPPAAKVRKAVERASARYGKALKKLAE